MANFTITEPNQKAMEICTMFSPVTEVLMNPAAVRSIIGMRRIVNVDAAGIDCLMSTIQSLFRFRFLGTDGTL